MQILHLRSLHHLINRNKQQSHTFCKSNSFVIVLTHLQWPRYLVKKRETAKYNKSRERRWVILTNGHLHTAVCHGQRVIRHGITGDLAVIGTGGRGKTITRCDMVRVCRVTTSVGPKETWIILAFSEWCSRVVTEQLDFKNQSRLRWN